MLVLSTMAGFVSVTAGQINWQPMEISSDSTAMLIQEYRGIRNSAHPDSLLCGNIIQLAPNRDQIIIWNCDVKVSGNISCHTGKIVLRDLARQRKVELHTFTSSDLLPGVYELFGSEYTAYEWPIFVLFRDKTD